MPPLAYLPLVVIWFGIDETAKIVVIYLACFAPIAMAARAGVRSATIEQIHAAYSLGGRFSQIVRHVVLSAALLEILTGLRIAIGFGWTTLVAAEMVAATGPRSDGAQRVELSAHRRRGNGHRADRVDRVAVRSGHARV
ncbi:ABC transporter permease subunit [Paraburkholderia sp. BL27I4N3]|uniref:ABC transporter permease subunit n=1 Tax=Paraburkholderia sp. BL27I4N3 TaxID=1938805 RepID=UPI0038574BC2